MKSKRYVDIHTKQYESQIKLFDDPLELSNVTLYQIGEYNAYPGFYSGTHLQECHEIAIILNGSCIQILDGTEYHAKEGSIFVIPQGVTHATIENNGSYLRIFFLGFVMKDAPSGAYPYGEIHKMYTDHKVYTATDTVNINSVINCVLSEVYNQPPGYMRAIESYIDIILMLTWRSVVSTNVSMVSDAYSNGEANKIPTIYVILRYIDDHIQSIGTIKAMASEIGFDYEYISNLFHSKTNIKLSDYINKKKMEYACSLMQKGGISVHEVADKCGYRSTAAFIRAFKRVTGKTPMEYMTLNADNTQNQPANK